MSTKKKTIPVRFRPTIKSLLEEIAAEEQISQSEFAAIATEEKLLRIQKEKILNGGIK